MSNLLQLHHLGSEEGEQHVVGEGGPAFVALPWITLSSPVNSNNTRVCIQKGRYMSSVSKHKLLQNHKVQAECCQLHSLAGQQQEGIEELESKRDAQGICPRTKGSCRRWCLCPTDWSESSHRWIVGHTFPSLVHATSSTKATEIIGCGRLQHGLVYPQNEHSISNLKHTSSCGQGRIWSQNVPDESLQYTIKFSALQPSKLKLWPPWCTFFYPNLMPWPY